MRLDCRLYHWCTASLQTLLEESGEDVSTALFCSDTTLISQPITFLHLAILRRELNLVKWLLYEQKMSPHYVPGEEQDRACRQKPKPDRDPTLPDDPLDLSSEPEYLTAFQLAAMLYRPAAELMDPEFQNEAEELAYSGGSTLHCLENWKESYTVLYAAARGEVALLQEIVSSVPSEELSQIFSQFPVSPICCAIVHDQVETVKFLVTQPCSTCDLVLMAAWGGALNVLQFLLAEYPPEVEPSLWTARTSYGDSVTLVATGSGQLPVLQWLLQNTLQLEGADPKLDQKETILIKEQSHFPSEHQVSCHNTISTKLCVGGGQPAANQEILETVEIGQEEEEEQPQNDSTQSPRSDDKWSDDGYSSRSSSTSTIGCCSTSRQNNPLLTPLDRIRQSWVWTMQNTSGETPLLVACNRGRLSIVKWLLSTPPSAYPTDICGSGAAEDEDEPSNQIFGLSSIAEISEHGNTALLCAARGGDVATTRYVYHTIEQYNLFPPPPPLTATPVAPTCPSPALQPYPFTPPNDQLSSPDAKALMLRSATTPAQYFARRGLEGLDSNSVASQGQSITPEVASCCSISYTGNSSTGDSGPRQRETPCSANSSGVLSAVYSPLRLATPTVLSFDDTIPDCGTSMITTTSAVALNSPPPPPPPPPLFSSTPYVRPVAVSPPPITDSETTSAMNRKFGFKVPKICRKLAANMTKMPTVPLLFGKFGPTETVAEQEQQRDNHPSSDAGEEGLDNPTTGAITPLCTNYTIHTQQDKQNNNNTSQQGLVAKEERKTNIAQLPSPSSQSTSMPLIDDHTATLFHPPACVCGLCQSHPLNGTFPYNTEGDDRRDHNTSYGNTDLHIMPTGQQLPTTCCPHQTPMPTSNTEWAQHPSLIGQPHHPQLPQLPPLPTPVDVNNTCKPNADHLLGSCEATTEQHNKECAMCPPTVNMYGGYNPQQHTSPCSPLHHPHPPLHQLPHDLCDDDRELEPDWIKPNFGDEDDDVLSDDEIVIDAPDNTVWIPHPHHDPQQQQQHIHDQHQIQQIPMCNESGDTALTMAAYNGCLQALRFLIEEKHQPLQANKLGNTPLLVAAEGGHLHVVKYLIEERHASPAETGENGDSTLLAATYSGQLTVMKWLLQTKKADINERNDFGNTAVLYSAINGHLNSIKWLISEGGAAVNDHNKSEDTPFLLAAYYGHIDILQWLYNYDQTTANGSSVPADTALLLAARNGHINTLKWLLKAKISTVNEEGENGDTALLTAAYNGKLEVVKWLLQEGGSSIRECNGYGNSVLLYAAITGQLAVVQWLVTEGGARVDERNDNGDSALLLAAFYGHLEVVKWLCVNTEATVTEANSTGDTALLLSSKAGYLGVVSWLYHYAPSCISTRNKHDNTVLIMAAEGGHLHIVKWLLNNKIVSVNETGQNRDTALLAATYNGKLNTVKWLLQEGGASISEKNRYGNTALLYAAINGHIELVMWLLQHAGASVQEHNDYGNTPLLLSAYYGHLEVTQWLLQHGGSSVTECNDNGDTALLLAAIDGQLKVVKWLLSEEGGSHIRETGQNGDTALLAAAYNGQLHVVKWLLTEGKASSTDRNQYGNTALLYGAITGKLEVVKWLLDASYSQIDEKNLNGDTTLLLGAYYGHLPVVQWVLTEGGASITEKGENGETALLAAAASGCKEIVSWLLVEGGASINDRNKHGDGVLMSAWNNTNYEVVSWLITSGWDAPNNILLNDDSDPTTMINMPPNMVGNAATGTTNGVGGVLPVSGLPPHFLGTPPPPPPPPPPVPVQQQTTAMMGGGGNFAQQQQTQSSSGTVMTTMITEAMLLEKCRIPPQLLRRWRPRTHVYFPPRMQETVALILFVRDKLRYTLPSELYFVMFSFMPSNGVPPIATQHKPTKCNEPLQLQEQVEESDDEDDDTTTTDEEDLFRD